jgi:hypothetical protein
MQGGECGQGVTLSRGYFELALGWVGSRMTVRTMRTKSKAPEQSGAFVIEGTSIPRKNVNICYRFSEQPWYRHRNQRCLDPMDSPRRLS